METYIVDASVGIKWYFDEEGRESAVHLFTKLKERKAKLIVPEIFFAEFASACWKKVQRRLAKTVDVLNIFDRVAELPLVRYSDHELSDVALEDALRLGISVYDAIYIALAEIYVAPLVTADDVLIKTCRNRFDFILPLWEI